MKLIVLLLITLFTSAVYSQQLVSSEINEVTVFQNGAQISRKINAKLITGIQELTIKGLPENLDPNSIRVSSDAETILQAVRHEINYIESAEDKALTLKSKKEKLLDDAAKINQQISILKFEKISLEKNQVQIIGVSNSNLKLEDLKALVAYQTIRLQELLPKIYEQDKKLQAVQLEIEKVNQQIQEINQNKSKPSSDLVLTVLSKNAGTHSFQLQYYVGNANWVMNYDIVVKDIKSPMEIVFKATVYQSTGEDWKNVKVNLSTANPFEGADRPILSPWYLRNQPPIVYDRMSKREAPPSQNQMSKDAIESTAGVGAAYVQESQQLTSNLFAIDLPYTILSNNKPFVVEIKKASVAARYTYFAIPKLDRDAFLTAEVEDWESLNLVDGEANLFLEGSFQGKMFIQTRSIQDFLRLSLGRDKSISIERNKIKDFTKNKFLSDKKIISKAWEIIIKNKKNTSIDIIIEDQLPVTTEKSITVKADELSGADLSEDTGKLRWTLKIGAGEQKKLQLRYSVEAPKDYILNLE
jgi:uncharacterized protein (TIGR02231 family)